MAAISKKSGSIVLLSVLIGVGAIAILLRCDPSVRLPPQDPVRPDSALSDDGSGDAPLAPAPTPMDSGKAIPNRKEVAKAPKLSSGIESRRSGTKRTPKTIVDLRQTARWMGVNLEVPADLSADATGRLRSIHEEFIAKCNLLEKKRGPLVTELADKLESQGQYTEWKPIGSVKDPDERARIRREIRAARAAAGDNYALRSSPKYTRLIVVPPGHSPVVDDLTRKFRENAMDFVVRAQSALRR